MTSSPSRLSLPKYRSDIDGLRAIAVLSVVIFHAFPKSMKGGYIGVDVFFVISGFLISTILFENLDDGTFSFAEFYARRIKRIFPALLLVLIASYAFGWFALLAGEYKQLGKHIAASAAFVSNFALWQEAGYFDDSAEIKPLIHLWSLGIEEQFYLVWPALLWLGWKRRFNLLTVTVLVAAVSFYLNMVGIRKDAVATFYSPQTRFWELLCGSLLSWTAIYAKDTSTVVKTKIDGWLGTVIYSKAPEPDGATLSNVLSFLGLALLAYGFFSFGKKVVFPGGWAVIPVLGAMLLISAGPKACINRVVLSHRLAVWIGLVSFPLYLWHWPLLSFAHIVEDGVPSRAIRIAAVVLSFGLACLTYRLVEKPIRTGNHTKAKVAILSMLMVAIACVGFVTYRYDGLQFRLKKFLAVQELVANPFPDVEGFDCEGRIPEFKDLEFNGHCKFTKDAPASIVFVGDSHMAIYRTAVWDKFKSQSVLMIIESMCFPFSGNELYYGGEIANFSGNCEQKTDALIRYMENSPSVKVVVLTGYWAYLLSGDFEKNGENWRIPAQFAAGDVKTFTSVASKLISGILKSGKQVVLMKDVPDLDFNVKTCFDIRPFRLSDKPNLRKDCAIDYAAFKSRVAPADAVIEDILRAFPAVKVYDPRPLFCSTTKCAATDGARPYYGNGDHLNYYGADVVVDDLVSKVEALRN